MMLRMDRLYDYLKLCAQAFDKRFPDALDFLNKSAMNFRKSDCEIPIIIKPSLNYFWQIKAQDVFSCCSLFCFHVAYRLLLVPGLIN